MISITPSHSYALPYDLAEYDSLWGVDNTRRLLANLRTDEVYSAIIAWHDANGIAPCPNVKAVEIVPVSTNSGIFRTELSFQVSFRFLSSDHAMLFKLTWGGAA